MPKPAIPFAPVGGNNGEFWHLIEFGAEAVQRHAPVGVVVMVMVIIISYRSFCVSVNTGFLADGVSLLW